MKVVDIPEIYIQVRLDGEVRVPDGHDHFKMKCGPESPRNCDRCLKQKGVLKVCPTCGASIGSIDRDRNCSCGTVIWTCHDAEGKVYVAEFSRPSPIVAMTMTEDDVI